MDVVREVEEVAIFGNHYFSVFTLPESACALVLLVEVLCIAHIYLFHKYRNTVLYHRRYEDVIVIIHKRKGVNSHKVLASLELMLA